MAHIFIPNGIRVVLRATDANSGLLLHTFHMQAPNPAPDYADCLAAAQIVATWWGSNYRNMVGSQVTGRDVIATGMNAVPAAQATALLTLPGTRGGAPLPSGVSMALKWYTHVSGHTNYGGVRGWPPSQGDVVGDHFTAAYVTAMLGVFGNLLTAAGAGGYPLVIASLRDVALKIIAGVEAVDDIVDSQRRRLLGRGR